MFYARSFTPSVRFVSLTVHTVDTLVTGGGIPLFSFLLVLSTHPTWSEKLKSRTRTTRPELENLETGIRGVCTRGRGTVRDESRGMYYPGETTVTPMELFTGPLLSQSLNTCGWGPKTPFRCRVEPTVSSKIPSFI